MAGGIFANDRKGRGELIVKLELKNALVLSGDSNCALSFVFVGTAYYFGDVAIGHCEAQVLISFSIRTELQFVV